MIIGRSWIRRWFCVLQRVSWDIAWPFRTMDAGISDVIPGFTRCWISYSLVAWDKQTSAATIELSSLSPTLTIRLSFSFKTVSYACFSRLSARYSLLRAWRAAYGHRMLFILTFASKLTNRDQWLVCFSFIMHAVPLCTLRSHIQPNPQNLYKRATYSSVTSFLCLRTLCN